ncbi:family 20 glycosylhydrolase [Agromyces albus]|uniref:beta-N-acetylhexosaminidase n=1 Tax=Agromyces albus TaxID=205332 RepID=A0A4Q2L4E5_9MICO|nr:family 20 glycosylhydrolase [Agromyces albus]RXZ71212.1 hypothetical protein ESP51_08320 [Agromyces albus]
MINEGRAEVAVWRIADASEGALLAEALPGAAALMSRAFGQMLEQVTEASVADIVIRTGPASDPAEGVDPRPAGRRSADESYRIEAEGQRFVIRARASEGVFRALLTIASRSHDGHPIAMDVEDAPKWAWRGLSLDVVRRWFPCDEVERVIDLLAILRMNVLHLHLSDREAWRLELDGYPALTREASHYSTADVERLVSYARQRFITIVPEIDMPGHVAAAVSAVPALAARPFPAPELAYLTWSSPEVPRFVGAVLDQVVALFDSPYIHIGGDEAFGMPEDEYADFVRHAAAAVRARGRLPLGWQETSRAGCWTPSDVVQLWVGERDRFDSANAYRNWPEEWHPAIPALAAVADQAVGDPARIAAQGAAVLVSTSDPLYLDRRPAEPSLHPEQNERLRTVGNADYEPTVSTSIRRWDPARQPDIVEHGLRVAGIEAAIWCESIATFDDLALLMLPRLAMVAEHGWSRDGRDPTDSGSAWTDAWSRLGFHGFHRSSLVFGEPSGH